MKWIMIMALSILVAFSFVVAKGQDFQEHMEEIDPPTVLGCGKLHAERAFVGTESGWVKAIFLKDGQLEWNSRHGTGAAVTVLKVAGSLLVTGIARGSVKAWDAGTGEASWEFSLGSNEALVDVLTLDNSVLVVGESSVASLAEGGRQTWSHEVGGPGTAYFAAGTSENQSHVCLVSIHGKGKFGTITKLDRGTGAVVAELNLPAKIVKAFLSHHFIVAGNYLVFISEETLFAYSICGEDKFLKFDLSVVRTRPPSDNRLLPWPGTEGVFTVTNDAFTFIFRLVEELAAGGPEMQLKMARVENAVGTAGQVSTVGRIGTDDDVLVVLRRSHGYETKFIDTKTGEESDLVSVEYSVEHGNPQLLAACGSEDAQSILMRTTDGVLAAFQDEKVVWYSKWSHKTQEKQEL